MARKFILPVLIIVVLAGFFFASATYQARAGNDLNFPVPVSKLSAVMDSVNVFYSVNDLSGVLAVEQGSPGEPQQGSPAGPSHSAGSVQLPNFIGVDTIEQLILKIVNFLIILAIPFAVLMLIWAGFQFATAQGSEGKLKKAKTNLLWTVAGIGIILASKAIVSYITDVLGGGTGQNTALVNTIKATLNEIIALLFILVTVYFFWGVVQFVRASSGGDATKITEGKKHMIWGIIGMAVMAGAWGIVSMIKEYVQ